MNGLDATRWNDGYEHLPFGPPFHSIRSCPVCDAVYRYDDPQKDEAFRFSDDDPWGEKIPSEREPGRNDYFHAVGKGYAKTHAEEVELLTWIWWHANHRRRYDVRDLFEMRRSGPPKLQCDPMEVERYLLYSEQYWQELQLRMDFYLADPASAKTAFLQAVVRDSEDTWDLIFAAKNTGILEFDDEDERISPPLHEIGEFDDLGETQKVDLFLAIAECELLSSLPETPECLSDLEIDFDYEGLPHLDRYRWTRRLRLTRAKKYWEQVRTLDQQIDEYHNTVRALEEKISTFAFESREIVCLRRLADCLSSADPMRKAEVLRELGEFDEAIGTLESASINSDWDQSRSESIRELCNGRDSGLVCTWVPSMQFSYQDM